MEVCRLAGNIYTCRIRVRLLKVPLDCYYFLYMRRGILELLNLIIRISFSMQLSFDFQKKNIQRIEFDKCKNSVCLKDIGDYKNFFMMEIRAGGCNRRLLHL